MLQMSESANKGCQNPQIFLQCNKKVNISEKSNVGRGVGGMVGGPEKRPDH